jgi:hypothetical protein
MGFDTFVRIFLGIYISRYFVFKVCLNGIDRFEFNYLTDGG